VIGRTRSRSYPQSFRSVSRVAFGQFLRCRRRLIRRASRLSQTQFARHARIRDRSNGGAIRTSPRTSPVRSGNGGAHRRRQLSDTYGRLPPIQGPVDAASTSLPVFDPRPAPHLPGGKTRHRVEPAAAHAGRDMLAVSHAEQRGPSARTCASDMSSGWRPFSNGHSPERLRITVDRARPHSVDADIGRSRSE
jgi:hypothetical protein